VSHIREILSFINCLKCNEIALGELSIVIVLQLNSHFRHEMENSLNINS
jgi:hypothetical protein